MITFVARNKKRTTKNGLLISSGLRSFVLFIHRGQKAFTTKRKYKGSKDSAFFVPCGHLRILRGERTRSECFLSFASLPALVLVSLCSIPQKVSCRCAFPLSKKIGIIYDYVDQCAVHQGEMEAYLKSKRNYFIARTLENPSLGAMRLLTWRERA